MTVTHEGLYTVYDCRAAGDAAVRFYACGGGESAYLGLAIPENGHLMLRKRLTKLDMRTFPRTIEYISDTAPAPEPALSSDPGLPREREPEIGDAPDTQPEPPQDDDLLWYSYPNGTLTAFDGINRYLALPYDRINAGEGIQRTIEGRKYIVFQGRKH